MIILQTLLPEQNEIRSLNKFSSIKEALAIPLVSINFHNHKEKECKQVNAKNFFEIKM